MHIGEWLLVPYAAGDSGEAQSRVDEVFLASTPGLIARDFDVSGSVSWCGRPEHNKPSRHDGDFD
jgi:hypothetical protein